jgi:hypothetical protein
MQAFDRLAITSRFTAQARSLSNVKPEDSRRGKSKIALQGDEEEKLESLRMCLSFFSFEIILIFLLLSALSRVFSPLFTLRSCLAPFNCVSVHEASSRHSVDRRKQFATGNFSHTENKKKKKTEKRKKKFCALGHCRY